MRLAFPVAALVLSGCATAAPTVHAPPATPTPPAAAPALPPVPLVTGPLAIKVVYPVAGSLVQSRDSNFIFGSVGNGHASLTIDGTPVRVLPNGSFLAFLPVPSADRASYELVATLDSETVRVTHPVKLLPPPTVLPLEGALAVDSASITPAPGARLAYRDDEMMRVAIRAPANASVTWIGDQGATAPLVSGAARAGAPLSGDAGGTPRVTGGSAELFATELPARALRARTELVITRGGDTLHVPLGNVAPAPISMWALIGGDSSSVDDVDREIIGRPVPGGTYKWFLLPGTILGVTGWSGDFVRVRLDASLEIWLSAAEVRPMPPGWAPAGHVAGSARLAPSAEWVDLVIPMPQRPAYLVEEADHEITLTLYGVTIDTDLLHYAGDDSLVRVARWIQDSEARGRFTLELARQPYGYLAFWNNGSFVLRVRRPPAIDPTAPLRGLTIAVDPGHPPIGATGPTGLWEPVATLAVGLEVQRLLQARGATVVMTRTTDAPVALGDRPIIARKANAHALVSIHLNALPDGIDPFTNNGTGAYYFRAHSVPLARALQDAMVRHMGLRNLGINYDNLRLARPTWMPAVLCEGAFIMMPEQEAALRTPEFQHAYAAGIVEGLERYFRALATR